MSYTPSTSAQNTAALAGTNLATLAAPLTALQTAITGGLLAPAAYIDALLSALGVQLESNNALSANSTSTASFLDVPGTSITFTAPVAKTYLVHCDFSFFVSAGNSGFFRLVVNGSNGPTLVHSPGATGLNSTIHLMHSATCVQGANTIKVQWEATGGSTLNVGTNNYANYIVSG